MKKKIVYVSGTRADFGLMTSVLKAIDSSSKLELLVYATGMHLMPKFGLTIKDIEKFTPNFKKINAVFKKDSKMGMAQFSADFSSQFFKQLILDKPDLLLVLGDRVEMLTAAIVASYFGLPIAHVHGGDKTTTIDEVARHAITKLAHLHFAATNDSAKRIKKLGEEEWRIHLVGAPSLDNMLSEQIPSKKEVYSFLNLNPEKKFILVLQHPSRDLIHTPDDQIRQTLDSALSFDLPIVVIYPNADPGGEKIIKVIEQRRKIPNFYIYPSLEYKMFLGLQREAAVFVGNSSAAIIESASFQIPVINIGDRQKGRLQSGNVINVNCDAEEIRAAIQKSLYNEEYRKKILTISNVWGDGRAAERIVKELEGLEIGSKLLNKQISY